MLIIYTDGSCKPNPGPGGWAFVVNPSRYSQGGNDKVSTNNRMELMAVIKALEYAKSINETQVTIHTDSQLTMMCAQKLWKRNLNLDLWAIYDSIGIVPVFVKVKAHSGDVFNTLVDSLANEFRNAL